MSRLTPEGQQALGELCRRHGVAEETGLTLLDALSRSNGTMAQFNLSELGGSGQWMSGGMTMVGDMFNYGLKARVDGLCCDLAALLATAPFRPAPTPSGFSLFVGAPGQWWPPGLGAPNWQGSQNDLRYAYFAPACRLALHLGGEVSVYDTRGFTLTGVGQQQSSGYGSSLTFTGPGGIVTLDRLRRIDPVTAPATPEPAVVSPPAPPRPSDRPDHRPRAAEAAQAAAEPADALDDRLAGSRWLYEPTPGATPLALLLDADGVLAGAGSDLFRYWAVDAAMLWFYAADGRATARFESIRHGADGVEITGMSPPDSGTPAVLRAPVSRPAAAPAPSNPASTALELRLELCGCDWLFGERGAAPLATLRLLRDGTVSGSLRATESTWRLEGSHLVFLHKSGRPTTRFTTVTCQDGCWTLSGPSLANSRIVHELSPS
ncbi:MAG: hypothetical protein WCO00_04965 [Rhodospirillaceae bacterium]